jgi:hypothetical protein
LGLCHCGCLVCGSERITYGVVETTKGVLLSTEPAKILLGTRMLSRGILPPKARVSPFPTVQRARLPAYP